MCRIRVAAGTSQRHSRGQDRDVTSLGCLWQTPPCIPGHLVPLALPALPVTGALCEHWPCHSLASKTCKHFLFSLQTWALGRAPSAPVGVRGVNPCETQRFAERCTPPPAPASPSQNLGLGCLRQRKGLRRCREVRILERDREVTRSRVTTGYVQQAGRQAQRRVEGTEVAAVQPQIGP